MILKVLIIVVMIMMAVRTKQNATEAVKSEAVVLSVRTMTKEEEGQKYKISKINTNLNDIINTK